MSVRLESVDLRYGGVNAVNDVSLELTPGERVAVIGPNGAGKSSLLALVGGQYRPSSGRVLLDGQDVTRSSSARRAHLGIARSFQIASLFPRLTVREQARLGLMRTNRLGWVRSRDGARESDTAGLLCEWGIPESVWDRLPGELSYGEQRSLELALALARRPKVLLLDEPNVGLTASENSDLVARIRALGDDMVVVLVAHDMDVVFGVADRVIVMQHGRVVVDGRPDEVRRDAKVAEIYFGGAGVGS